MTAMGLWKIKPARRDIDSEQRDFDLEHRFADPEQRVVDPRHPGLDSDYRTLDPEHPSLQPVRPDRPSGGAVLAGDLPHVSVILPVRNEARHLPGTLGALLAGDYPAELMEVLVVDGGSTDGSRQLVADLAAGEGRLRLLVNPAGTTPAGLNVGLHAARGEVIVRLDGHTQPAPDYIRSCVAALDRTGADAVGGHMVGRGETRFGRAVALATMSPFGAGDASYRLGGEGPVDTVYLGAWRRELFDRVGAFDEGLRRNQDYELCLRIREAGGTVWLDPAIRSTTVTRATSAALARQYFDYGTGRAATVARHPRSLRARQVVPALFVAALAVGMPAALVTSWARRVLALIIGVYVGVTTVVSTTIAARAGAGYLADLLLAFATMHLSWGVGFWVGLVKARRDRDNA